MKNLIIRSSFLLLVIFQLAQTQDPGLQTALTQIKKITQGDHFGGDLWNLIELQIDQSPQRSELLRLLKKVILQIERDLDDLDSLYSKNNARLNDDIDTLDHTLENLHAELKNTNIAIHDLSGELASMIEIYTHLKNQLSMIDGKEQEVRDDRAQNQLDYNNRQGNNYQTIKALEEINDKLTLAIFAQQDQQKKGPILTQIESENMVNDLINEFGPSNPAVILAQLTTSFDEKTVISIIERLEVLRDSLITTQQREEQAELKANLDFNTVVQQIFDARRGLSNDFYSLDSKVRHRANQRILEERNRDQLNEDVSFTQNAAIFSRNQRELSEAINKQSRVDLENQSRLVKQAFEIVLQQTS